MEENINFKRVLNLYYLCLSNIQKIITRIAALQLGIYRLPVPAIVAKQLNIDFVKEICYDRVELNIFVARNLRKLTEERRAVYDHVIVNTQNPTDNNIFFIFSAEPGSNLS